MSRDPRLRRRVAILFATAVAATQACSTGGDVGTNPTPSITLSINPTSATVVQGGSVAVIATLTGSGGFTGTGATFALTGAPGGITFSVSRFETSGSITTATITTSVAATVPPGTYTISLTGSGTGVRAVSASFVLTVPAPSIAISLTPTSVTVAQGGSKAIGATLTGIDGFTGAGAAFALTGAPAGITFAVSNLQTNGPVTTATVTTSVAGTVPPGTYVLEVTGSGTGVSPVSVPFAITVVEVCFTLSVSPATLTLPPEDVANATITINRTNGFAGSVALSGTSEGFWMLFDPTSTTGNSSIMTAGSSSPPGNYTPTIAGTAPGCVTQTATIAVTVP